MQGEVNGPLYSTPISGCGLFPAITLDKVGMQDARMGKADQESLSEEVNFEDRLERPEKEEPCNEKREGEEERSFQTEGNTV